MKQRITGLFLIAAILLCLCSCTRGNSSFVINFIDVGQGDSALIECDNHYMLIDGGNAEQGGDAVYDLLEEKGVQKLDILAISHLHEDHFAGLIKALEYVQKVDHTICNATEPKNHGKHGNTESQFDKFESRLLQIGSEITVPKKNNKTYKLGSARVKVLDKCANEENDSLVLLITYKNTKFLFTGDIGDSGLQRLSDKYQNDSDTPFHVDVLKMPHHGAYSVKLMRFLRTFTPEYIIISVGSNNAYGHPNKKTLDLLDDYFKIEKISELYRTDLNGTITLISNGNEVKICS